MKQFTSLNDHPDGSFCLCHPLDSKLCGRELSDDDNDDDDDGDDSDEDHNDHNDHNSRN